MSKIKVMDSILANKIAAGEVVEKTMNVVKELVENSIDAGADEISIDLIDSGVKEIKVVDNGVGMDRNDATLAFSPHATSKIENVEDLFSIESLGFRGEALPSIAAVSKVELKTSNGTVGTKVLIDGGDILKVENSDLQTGTIIKVKDLFYNTPVRLKYLKNLYIELANIIEYVNKMALSYPNIKFRLTNNGKVLLETVGDSNLLKVIYEIYGVTTAKKMIEIAGENDDYYISGYISFPEEARSNRNSITTLVNGRVIKNNELNRVITDTYHTYIPKTRFPVIVLNIDVDPTLIDINIHPTKMDIKFSKFKELSELVLKTIKKELETINLIPTASVREESTIESIKKDFSSVIDNFDKRKTVIEEVTLDLEESPIEIKEPTTEYVESRKIEEGLRIKRMNPIGIVHLTYIIAENEDGMYIIDQHAAAERINYELVLADLTKDKKFTISLIVPIKIELPKNEYLIVHENLDLINNLGFEIEEFGTNTIIVRSHPIWLKESYEEEDIRMIIEIVASHESFSKELFLDHLAATMACRKSIKANDYISHEEQIYLLETLSKCKNPFTCPHGRPTIITYTDYDLQKMFKRVVD